MDTTLNNKQSTFQNEGFFLKKNAYFLGSVPYCSCGIAITTGHRKNSLDNVGRVGYPPLVGCFDEPRSTEKRDGKELSMHCPRL